jgi:hypothetical protein
MTDGSPADMPPLFGAQLMPALHRHPDEAARIGRIVAAFGEIEFLLGLCLGEALSNRDAGLRGMFRLLTDRGRIDMADALARPAYEKIGATSHFDETIMNIKYCRRIRNQYAHCHYGDEWNGFGLYLTNLTDAAKGHDSFEYLWRHVDAPLLELQEAYFLHTIRGLRYLEWEYQFKTGKILSGHGLPWPTTLAPPPKHNPPSQHIPQWLPEEAKKRHLELAEGAEKPAQQPQRPPSVLRLTREEWAAKDARDGRTASKPAPELRNVAWLATAQDGPGWIKPKQIVVAATRRR